LSQVYKLFDIDGSGEVGFDEMLALGQARRRLGQKTGEWTTAQNERMMEKMGMNQNGDVTVKNFVHYFETNLASDAEEFAKIIEEFKVVAKACATGIKEKKEDRLRMEQDYVNFSKQKQAEKQAEKAEKQARNQITGWNQEKASAAERAAAEEARLLAYESQLFGQVVGKEPTNTKAKTLEEQLEALAQRLKKSEALADAAEA